MPEIRHWVQEATGSKAQPPYPGGFDPQFGPRDYGKAAGLAWERIGAKASLSAASALMPPAQPWIGSGALPALVEGPV